MILADHLVDKAVTPRGIPVSRCPALIEKGDKHPSMWKTGLTDGSRERKVAFNFDRPCLARKEALSPSSRVILDGSH
jgi:hypothetical protein